MHLMAVEGGHSRPTNGRRGSRRTNEETKRNLLAYEMLADVSTWPRGTQSTCLLAKSISLRIVPVTHLLHAHSASGRSAQSRPKQHTWYAPGQKSHSTRGENVAWYVSPHTPHLLEFAANCDLLTLACAGLGAPGATGPACDTAAAAAVPPLLPPALNCCHSGFATAGSKCCMSFVRTSATLMG